MAVARVSALGFSDTLTVTALGFTDDTYTPPASVLLSGLNSTAGIGAVSASGNIIALSGLNTTASITNVTPQGGAFLVNILGVNSTASAGVASPVTPMTNIKVGSTTLDELRVESTYIERAYVGPVLVWYKEEELGGQVAYTTPGTYSWTAPAGVTSVCVVCVGGGGGGMYFFGSGSGYQYAMNGGSGGGLAWLNDYAVTPGNSYTVVVGAGGDDGAYSSGSTAGGDSYFATTSTCRGGGGLPGRYNQDIAGGTYTVNALLGTSSGGGNGGGVDSRSYYQYGPAGGGGAGGYSGDGGDGRDNYFSSGEDGSGGGGAGGGASNNSTYENHISGGGGGVGILGEGASGVGQSDGSGQGGSGGASTAAPTNAAGVLDGGLYGGGGGGKSSSYWGSHAGQGGGGAVRIIWGEGRAFPSTNTGDVAVTAMALLFNTRTYDEYIASGPSFDTNTATLTTSLSAGSVGDLAILWERRITAHYSSQPASNTNSGWTSIGTGVTDAQNEFRHDFSYKIMTSSDISSGSITSGQAEVIQHTILFFTPSKSITYVSPYGYTYDSGAGTLSSQTQSITTSGASAPVIHIGVKTTHNAEAATLGGATYDATYYEGIDAVSGGTQDDGARIGYILQNTTLSNVTTTYTDEGANQQAATFHLKVV